jgi:hypothetical protein
MAISKECENFIFVKATAPYIRELVFLPRIAVINAKIKPIKTIEHFTSHLAFRLPT